MDFSDLEKPILYNSTQSFYNERELTFWSQKVRTSIIVLLSFQLFHINHW